MRRNPSICMVALFVALHCIGFFKVMPLLLHVILDRAVPCWRNSSMEADGIDPREQDFVVV